MKVTAGESVYFAFIAESGKVNFFNISFLTLMTRGLNFGIVFLEKHFPGVWAQIASSVLVLKMMCWNRQL